VISNIFEEFRLWRWKEMRWSLGRDAALSSAGERIAKESLFAARGAT
jgi:hypothetical protein